MIIGIDVGGTHADGVLLQKGKVVTKNKVLVDQENLSETIVSLLESLLPEKSSELRGVHLSTTLCTNALVNDNLDKVGMFIQAGPGLNPDFLRCGDSMAFLSGAIDHRGKIIRAPDQEEVKSAETAFLQKGITSVGVVTKFSHRNNEHELWLRDQLRDSFTHISMGHQLSGLPNFPRRVYTTWLNSGLMTEFLKFKEAMTKGFERLGVHCPCYILKADGGTIPFETACNLPCQSVHSGPSASVMGALALGGDMGDALLLDIGGTTTDIALFSEGIPLLEPYGASVGGRPTLIRALLTRSIGLGGDSHVVWSADGFQIGPEKKSQPMAFGGTSPTPTDALIALGLMQAGSVEKAKEAMLQLCPSRDVSVTAAELLENFTARVKSAAEEMINEIFARPVYTVSALLERKKIVARQLIAIGGPAQALQGILSKRFQLECQIPPDYEVANAIGAARARRTVQASLYCDTGERRLSIPEMSIMEVPGRMFTKMEAKIRLEEAIRAMAGSAGDPSAAEIDFLEELEMNTVRGFSTTGKIISLKAQIRPGLETREG